MKKRTITLLFIFVFLIIFSINVSANKCNDYKMYLEDGSFVGTVKVNTNGEYLFETNSNKLVSFSTSNTEVILKIDGSKGLFAYIFSLDEKLCQGKVILKKVAVPYSWDLDKSDKTYKTNYIILVFDGGTGTFVKGSVLNIQRYFTLTEIPKTIQDYIYPMALGVNSFISDFNIEVCTPDQVLNVINSGQNHQLSQKVEGYYLQKSIDGKVHYFFTARSKLDYASTLEVKLSKEYNVNIFGFNFNFMSELFVKNLILNSGTTCVVVTPKNNNYNNLLMNMVVW